MIIIMIHRGGVWSSALFSISIPYYPHPEVPSLESWVIVLISSWSFDPLQLLVPFMLCSYVHSSSPQSQLCVIWIFVLVLFFHLHF